MKDDSEIGKSRKNQENRRFGSIDDSVVSGPSSGKASPWVFDGNIERKVENLIATHNLKKLYIAERKYPDSYKEDSRRHWFTEDEWNKKKIAEKNRVKIAAAEFDETYKVRLMDLYKEKFKESPNFEHLIQDGLDDRVIEAFRERSDAQKRSASQEELMQKISNQFNGDGPSLVDKMIDNHRFVNKKLKTRDFDGAAGMNSLGRDSQIDLNASAPRSRELKWMEDNSRRFSQQKKLCDKNLDSVLRSGRSLDGVVYSEADTVKSHIGATGLAKTGLDTGKRSIFNFFNNVFNSGKRDDRYGADDINREDLANWNAYRDLQAKEKKLAHSYSDSLGFINKRSLNKLESIKADLAKAFNEATTDQEKYYLQQYAGSVDQSITDLKKALDEEKDGDGKKKKGLDAATRELNQSTDAKMQEALDDKNARLKWNILCVLLMASPFAQGLMVAGPLFDYLSFLGDILGPIFMNEEGFAAGFAQALENFPIFGELLKMVKFSDGVEFLFNEIPLVNAFTGQGGIIDGLTRNDIFTGLVETFNFEYLSIAGMVGGAAYLGVSNFNANYGDDTTNTKPSLKSIKKNHMEQMEKIFKQAEKDSETVEGQQSLMYNKKITGLNRDYFKKSAVVQTLEDEINKSKKAGNIDDLLKIFDGLNIFGTETLSSDEKVDKLKKHLGSDVFAKGESEFAKRATIFANEVVKDADVSYATVSAKINLDMQNKGTKDDSAEFKVADNAFSMHYYSKEMERLSIPGQKLWEMAKSNELGDFTKVNKMMEAMDNTIAKRVTDLDKQNGVSFFPKASPREFSCTELKGRDLNVSRSGGAVAA